MTKYTAMVTKAGDQMIEAVSATQGRMVQSVAQFSGIVGSYLPDLPALPLASVPSPRELVDSSFKLAEKALKSQRTYAVELTKALEPISAKVFRNGTARKPAKASA